MVTLFENTPRPSNAMPSSSRTVLCAPSAPIRYCAAQPGSRLPVSTSLDGQRDAVGILLDADHLVPGRAPWRRRLRRALRRIGSRPGWVTNSRRHGLSASTPSLRLGMMSASFLPASVSIRISAPSGVELLARLLAHLVLDAGAAEHFERAHVEEGGARQAASRRATARPRATEFRAAPGTSPSTGRPGRRRRSAPGLPRRVPHS